MSLDIRHNIGDRISEPIARFLARTRITPNILTVTGFLLNVAAAILAGYGIFIATGFVLLFSGLFDMLDGALARVTGKISRSGAILDSILDRFSEAVVLIGLIVYYLYASPSKLGVILVVVTLIGSMMVSYSRARAEGLGVDCKVGLFTRPERVILLASGLIFSVLSNNVLTIILWILAIGTMATALWRLIYLLVKADKVSGSQNEDQS